MNRSSVTILLAIFTILVTTQKSESTSLPDLEDVLLEVGNSDHDLAYKEKSKAKEKISQVMQDFVKAHQDFHKVENEKEDLDEDVEQELKADEINSDSSEKKSQKPVENLDISKSDLRRMFAEAEGEVQRDAPAKHDSQSSSFRHAGHRAFHYRARYDPEAEKISREALVSEKVMDKIAKKLGLSDDDAARKLVGLDVEVLNNENTTEDEKKDFTKRQNQKCNIDCYSRPMKFRSIDGICNNLRYPCRGAVNAPFRRLLPPDYGNKRSSPRKSKLKKHKLPNARHFSFVVFRDENRPSKSLSHMVMSWGQFLDHDITLVAHPTTSNCPKKNETCRRRRKGECFGIPILPYDPHFSRTGVKCIHVVRSAPAGRTKCDCKRRRLKIREQSNILTAFIDASQVYGPDLQTQNSMRPPSSSLLKLTPSGLLTENKNAFCRSCSRCFLSGDGRVNENPALVSLHTLFVREHNRISKVLTRLNGGIWDHERIFQETRKIIGAMMQHITYQEFLPRILNRQTRRQYGLVVKRRGYFRGYDESADATIFNSFATAAFRFGHSLVRNQFGRPGLKPIPTRNAFFNPCSLHQNGMDSIFQGLARNPAMRVDGSFSSAVTKHLNLSPDIIIDLPAVNIQRGRDHGIPSYNSFRELCGLGKATKFEDFAPQITFADRTYLYLFYRHVDNVDLFAGGIMEKPLRGAAVGPTFSCILGQQFQDLRRGDRFWYENNNRDTKFTLAQLNEIKKVSLARLICDNGDNIKSIQRRVMLRPNKRKNKIIPCGNHPRLNLQKWKA